MTIRASCGHEVEHLSHLWDYSVKEYTAEGNPAIAYVALCKDCFDYLAQEGQILYNEDEENEWLGLNKQENVMREITLNRKEIDKLVEFLTNFKDVQFITIRQGSPSGIGQSTEIKCSLFGNDSEPETTVDITDVSVW